MVICCNTEQKMVYLSGIPYPRHYNARILFFIMTFWGTFYSKNCPKNGHLTKKFMILFRSDPPQKVIDDPITLISRFCSKNDRTFPFTIVDLIGKVQIVPISEKLLLPSPTNINTSNFFYLAVIFANLSLCHFLNSFKTKFHHTDK